MIAAPARVAAEWSRRAAVEYTSAALTHHLVLWLIQAAVSPELVRLGLRIVDDELAHAELAVAVAQAAGESREPALSPTIAIDRAGLALALDGSRALEEEILRVCLGNFCLAETAAVHVFRALRRDATVEIARRALDRVLRDEVRHRDFGWLLLGALLEGPHGPTLRAHAAALLPSLWADVLGTYLPPDATARADWAAILDEERAWGLQPVAAYEAALARALRRDLRPRFAEHGLALDEIRSF